MVWDFLPIFPGAAACKPVGTFAACPGETEFCCIAPLQYRGRSSSSSTLLVHRRSLSKPSDALAHAAADAQAAKAGEDPVTALVTAPLGSRSTAQCDSSAGSGLAGDESP